MKVFIDADACPVKEETVAIARRYELPVVVVSCQNQKKMQGRQGIEVIQCGSGLDEADQWILDHAKEGDLVVTGDLEFARRCLSQKTYVMGYRSPIDLDSIGEGIARKNLYEEHRQRNLESKGSGGGSFGEKERSHYKGELNNFLQKLFQ